MVAVFHDFSTISSRKYTVNSGCTRAVQWKEEQYPDVEVAAMAKACIGLESSVQFFFIRRINGS